MGNEQGHLGKSDVTWQISDMPSYFTRRALLISALSASACQSAPVIGSAQSQFSCVNSIQPGEGLILKIKGDIILSDLSGQVPLANNRTIDFTTDTLFRVASISKLAVAETALALEKAGRISLTQDISNFFDRPLRHPQFPDAPITLERLLSHTSGLIDPAKYWLPAPGNISELITADIFMPHARPGNYFNYANLNYGLAATAMEALTQKRFDHLVRDYALVPLRLDAGFNSSGVSASRREMGSPLFRRDPTKDCSGWVAQVDEYHDRMSVGPNILSTPNYDLAEYRPGSNGTLFSPQGGLRASFSDLLKMGEAWLLSDAKPLWNSATQPGNSIDGHFVQFGLGRYIYPAETSPIPGVRLIGHAGEAYGFYGGLWAAPDHNAVFTFGQLGSTQSGPPMNGGRPNLRTTNRAFFDRVGKLIRDAE